MNSNEQTPDQTSQADPNRDKQSIISFGPALLVTAAFIGPGTVTAASIAGANYGFSLIWAVAFSVVATVVLQEMAARLGIVSGAGLAQAIRDSIQHPVARGFALFLVLGAILFGNSAYQTGNLVGAAAGLKEFGQLNESQEASASNVGEPNEVKDASVDAAAKKLDTVKVQGILIFAIVALIVIWIGRLELMKWLMAILVALMSLMFLYSAISSGPNWSEVAQGLIPRIPPAADRSKMVLFVIGLIGTTVVPYNLFLHASSAAEKWHQSAVDESSRRRLVRASFWDTLISVLIGGVVTSSILVTMAVAFGGSGKELTSLAQVGEQLETSMGSSARILFAVGLCAAGLSSAIAAPIAAAYATAGCFRWPAKLSDVRLKLVATAVVLVGVGFGTLTQGKSPVQIIILAQVANGLLLPLVAIFLLWVVNQKSLLGQFRNRWYVNAFAIAVILVTLVLASRQFILVSQKLMNLFGN